MKNLTKCFEMLLLYLISMCFILDNSHMWILVTNSPLFKKDVTYVLIALCLILFISSRKLKMSTTSILLIVLIMFLFAIYALYTRKFVMGFLIGYAIPFFVMFVFGSYLLTYGKIWNFFRAYSNIMLVIAVFSLFFWLFGSQLDIIPGRRNVAYDWAEQINSSYTYYGLYYENLSQNIGQITKRNVGFFAEAPGYSGHLIYAFLIELVLRRYLGKKDRRINTVKIIVFFFTILSTLSTKGIMACLMVFLIRYMYSQNSNKFITIIKWFLGVFVIIGVAVVGYLLIEQKMTTTGNMRLDDLIAGIKAWKGSPVFGVGYSNSTEIIKNFSVYRSNNGISMGISALLAYGGLLFLLIYFGAAWAIKKTSFFERDPGAWVLVVFILVYNLFVSNCGYTNVYIFLVACSYASVKLKKISLDGSKMVLEKSR